MVREVDPQTQISTRNFEGKLKITSKEMLIKQIKNKQRKVEKSNKDKNHFLKKCKIVAECNK